MSSTRRCAALLVLLCCFVALAVGLKEESPSVHESRDANGGGDFVHLAMIQLAEHEDMETPPFSVCKYLLEASSEHVSKGDDWSTMAKHISTVRESLPEHVRSACDAFIKHNQADIVSLLQVGDDDMTAALEAVAQEDEAVNPSAQTSTTKDQTQAPSAEAQQQLFKKFWEEKGKYCGACLTMTKKIQKWLSLNCTQNVITDRVMRMCTTMPPELRKQCEGSHVWIRDYVIKQLLKKFPLPNHCAYIGLCEKTMVIRALQNPLVMSESQNAFIQDLEGTGNLVQENEAVLQKPHDTVTTTPEVTFNLNTGDVSYRDVDRASGTGLPKIFVDGTRAPAEEGASFLEVEEGPWDLTNPQDPQFTVNAQESDKINVPIMHSDLKKNNPTTVSKNMEFQKNKLPIETKYLKGCAACQFTVGALFEFMSNPRTARTILPAVKKACRSCNSPDEIAKCEEFVEQHGVAFFQDVVRQGSPSKWCPRLELCEIQYFQPSPHVLADNYGRVKDKLTAIDDF